MKCDVVPELCKRESRFHSGIRFEVKLTFIMGKIKIVCKIQSFIHVLSAKIAEKISESVQEFGASYKCGTRFLFTTMSESSSPCLM